MTDERKKADLKEPVDIQVEDHTYQPSKADQEEEIDMPGWSLDRVRETFMRPFNRVLNQTPM